MSTKVVTGKVRGSYVNVFKARINDLSGKEEFSLALLIPKSDKKTVGKINSAVQEAATNKFGDKVPAMFRHPLRDGDEERPDDPAYAEHYFLNVKSQQKPGIVDKDRNEVIDTAEFLSGDYCRCSLNAYAYDMKGNKGAALGLNNIQVLAKGEPLTSATRAEDEFGSWDDEDEDDWG